MNVKEIYLATKNENKIKEIMSFNHSSLVIRSLNDLSKPIDWNETGETFFENALIKAKAVKAYTSLGVLGEDSGLVVEDLNGEPGVYSNRYAGENCTDKDNIKKLLTNLEKIPNSKRHAYFITCLVYIDEKNNQHTYNGYCHGTIIKEPRGAGGFGYDPIFVPKGHQQSFSEIDPEEKNKMSHRFHAFQLFLEDQKK